MEVVTDNDSGLNSREGMTGSLEDTSLPSLLTSLAESGRTGVLRMADLGEIWLRDGLLYLASAFSSTELSKVLFDADLGSRDDIASTLRANAEEGTDAIGALLERSPGAEDQVARLLHEYNLEALFEMLVARTGDYRFEPDVIHALGHRFAEDTVALVEKAQTRTDIWRRIAARIPSTGAIFKLTCALPTPLDQRVVTADEWRFLSRLNGRNTVADVINQTGESAFRVCSSLYRLLLENVIEEAQP